MDLTEALQKLQEAHNLGDWLESRIHLAFTMIADDLFGDGRVTRDERIALSGGIGAALDAFRTHAEANAADVFSRGRWESPSAPMVEAEAGAAKSVEIETEFVPLLERALDTEGNGRIKLIRAGWGSSGYYGADMLRRDGPRVFAEGTHMYWNHPTATEEAERPERDLSTMAGVFTGNAAWEEDGERGPGLYAPVQVFEPYRESVNEMAEHIGVSIRAAGRARTGEADGRKGRIIDEIVQAASTDFVTKPGAGGEIVQMFESARRNIGTSEDITNGQSATPADEPTDTSSTQESNQMDENVQEQFDALTARLDELSEANTTLTTAREGDQAEIARLTERLLLADGARLIQSKIPTDLPTMTRQRLAESLVRNLPTTEGGELDIEALSTRVDEAVTSERDYLASVLGSGQITGMGESQDVDEDTDEAIKEANAVLADAFRNMGLSDDVAQIAVAGR